MRSALGASGRRPGAGNMESERDMYRQFQDWCLRTYGDSGKTKTVTRKKYERIVQLLNGSESSSTDNAKFKFWVKSKGFQLGQPDEVRGGGGGAKQVLYVPVKTTVSDSPSSVICLRQQPGGEGRERRERGGAVSHRWLMCPHPPQPPPQVVPTLISQARFPHRGVFVILYFKAAAHLQSPPLSSPPGSRTCCQSFQPRVGQRPASSCWAIVPCPPLGAWRVSRLRHRA